ASGINFGFGKPTLSRFHARLSEHHKVYYLQGLTLQRGVFRIQPPLEFGAPVQFGFLIRSFSFSELSSCLKHQSTMVRDICLPSVTALCIVSAPPGTSTRSCLLDKSQIAPQIQLGLGDISHLD